MAILGDMGRGLARGDGGGAVDIVKAASGRDSQWDRINMIVRVLIRVYYKTNYLFPLYKVVK